MMRKTKLWVLAVIVILCGACVITCCSSDDNPSGQPTIERITERGTLLVGTTGDYRPLSYKEADGTLRQLHEKYGLVYGY